jgi:ABC-type multidrug transport system fused ATPase/permease subunit
MEFFQIINIFANILICIGMTGFYVLLFGNSHSIVHKWPIIQHWSLKIAIVSVIATSAWNAMNVVYKMVVPRAVDVITYTTTPVGEVLMNVGLAFLFAWVVYFHKFHFAKVAPPKTSTRKPAVKNKKKVIPRKK